jgi:hypothetical protein
MCIGSDCVALACSPFNSLQVSSVKKSSSCPAALFERGTEDVSDHDDDDDDDDLITTSGTQDILRCCVLDDGSSQDILAKLTCNLEQSINPPTQHVSGHVLISAKAETVSFWNKFSAIAIQVGVLVLYIFLITSAYSGVGHTGGRKARRHDDSKPIWQRMFLGRADAVRKAGTKGRRQTLWQTISNTPIFMDAKESLGNVTAVKSLILEAAGALRSKPGERFRKPRRSQAEKGQHEHRAPSAAMAFEVSDGVLAGAFLNGSVDVHHGLACLHPSPHLCPEVPGMAEAEVPEMGGATEVYGLAETEDPGFGGAIKAREECAAQGSCRRPSPWGSDSKARVELCEAQGGEMVRWRCVMPKRVMPREVTLSDEVREVKAPSRWKYLEVAMRWPFTQRLQASAGAWTEEEEEEEEGLLKAKAMNEVDAPRDREEEEEEEEEEKWQFF